MMTPRKLQVFVSSTYLDLRIERQAAVTAILENGHIPAGMELFAAGNEEQMEVIKRWIDESDIFLLILGRRYGSLEPNRAMSYIEMEYEYAVSQSKPLFAVVLSEKFIDSKIRSGASADELFERESPDKYKLFQGLVTSKLCKFADDEKDIRLAVAQSIRDLERRHEFIGWVSGSQATSDTTFLAELGATAKLAASLQEKNSVLEKELETLRKRVSDRGLFEGRTFAELCQILKSEKVQFDMGEGKLADLDLLAVARVFKNNLARGVTNSGDKLATSLFWNVASPLVVYGLVEHGKVPASVYWQRLQLSASGKRFLSDLEASLLGQEQEGAGLQRPAVESATKASISTKESGDLGLADQQEPTTQVSPKRPRESRRAKMRK